MKTLVTLIIVLAPVLAQADKTYTGGKGATWDCAKDATVLINHGRGTYTFKGACKSIKINGGENKLTIAEVDTLDVTGAKNTINVGEVETINIVGAGNAINWKKTKSGDKPAINTVGTGNNIDQAK